MTLVITFGNSPIMVADLLLSNTLPKAFDHLPLKVSRPDGTPHYGGYFVQKIVRLQDGFHIACAGYQPAIIEFIKFARALHWPAVPTNGFSDVEIKALIEPLIEKLGKYYVANKLSLQYLIYANGFQCGVNPSLVQTPVGPALVIGTGTDDFRRFAAEPFNFNANRADFPGQECVVFALNFFAKYLITGDSIPMRWFGMEMLSQGARIDRILYQAFFWENDGGTDTRFEQLGDRIFSFYRGDKLFLIRQGADGAVNRFRAAPINEGYNQVKTLKDVPSSPKLTCTLFVNKSDFTRRSSIRYYEAGDRVCFIPENGASINYSAEELSKRFTESTRT